MHAHVQHQPYAGYSEFSWCNLPTSLYRVSHIYVLLGLVHGNKEQLIPLVFKHFVFACVHFW